MKKPILLLILFFCFCSINAQVIFKGFDLNISGNSNPENFIVVNNTLFFSAQNGTSGNELWYYDGLMPTPAMLKDINPGTAGSLLSNFAELNGKLIFSADDGTNGNELWISDGTFSGTAMLKNIAPTGSSNPDAFCLMNGKLYFKANDGLNGPALWATDGTAAGTLAIASVDIYTVYSSAITAFNNKIYFAGDDGINGIELWISNGTVGGTTMLKDIHAIGSSIPKMFYPFNGKMYFEASTNTTGHELWVTDGTTVGTNILTDLWTGLPSGIYHPYQFIFNYNNRLYFNGDDGIKQQYGLYTTDGTVTGIQKLHDITTTSLGIAILRYPTLYMGKLYFMTETLIDGDLWVTDGTQAGTHIVKDIQPDTSFPTHMKVFKNKMYFAAYTSAGNYQLFRSDGTGTGTNMIQPASANTNALSGYNQFNGFMEFKGKLYFKANYTSTGHELWCIDDTSTSIHNTSNVSSFSIYPNPSDGNFTIELKDGNFKDASVSVYDIMGRFIKSEKLISKSETISINQPKGIYLVKLQVDDAVMTSQITIE